MWSQCSYRTLALKLVMVSGQLISELQSFEAEQEKCSPLPKGGRRLNKVDERKGRAKGIGSNLKSLGEQAYG